MPNPNAIVSQRIRLDPPLEGSASEILRSAAGLSVELDDGRRVPLSADNPRSAGFAQVLDGLARQKLPVYLEVDPGSGAITRLLIPHVGRVYEMRPIDAGYDVELEYSHARYRLSRDQPDFADLEKQLRTALEGRNRVIVTFGDANEILDIRDFMPGPDDGPLPDWPKPKFPPLEKNWIRDLLDWFRRWWLWRWCFWPWHWFGCISMTKAQQVFNAMSATSCSPLTVVPPCIPFMFPDDGCWGRAHEMRRLMVAMGLNPKKVWIQGGLHTLTRNNPNCYVNWGWHVAPTLCVRRRGWWWWCHTEEMVIDPSLFTTPVSQATWKSVQGDPNASLTPTAGEIFWLWTNGTDPTYSQTNTVLATYRLQLLNRSLLPAGPPPYANCP